MNSVFVGRENEQELLNAMLSNSIKGSFQFCFIAGDRGDGKTTLVEYFAENAQNQFNKLNYALGTCQEITRDKSYEPFQDIFAQLTGARARKVHGTLGSEREFDFKQKVQIVTQTLVDVTPDLIGVLIPGVALLTKVIGVTANHIIKRRIEASKNIDIRVDHIKEQCVRFFSEITASRPLIIILDDVQWIDLPSFTLLQYLAENLSKLPILFIATYRPNEISKEFRDWINVIEQELGDVVIDLRINRQEDRGYEFVQSFLLQNRCNVNEKFIEEFYRRTEAKPLFSVELLRYLKSSKVLIEDSLGMWEENPKITDWTQIPTRITKLEALIEYRLRLLNEDLVEMLRIASIEGHEFSAQVVVTLTGQSERHVLEVFSEILNVEHGLVTEIGEEIVGATPISHFRFTNILYQEHIYSSIGSSVRRVRHRDVAKALEDLYADDLEQVATQLAQHYEKAMNFSKAAEYLVIVGRQHLLNRRTDDAIITLDRALSLARHSNYVPAIIDSLRLSAMEFIEQRKYEKAEPFLQESIDLARQNQNFSALSYSLRGLGRLRAAKKKNSEAMYYYMEGLHLAKQNNELELARACLNNIGVLANAEGRFDDGAYFLQQCLDIAESIDSDEGRYFALVNLGGNKRKTGQYETARHYFERALRIVSKRQDWQRECGIKIGLAHVAVAETNLYMASHLLTETLDIIVMKKDLSRQLQFLNCAADILSRTDNVDVAARIIGYMESSGETNTSDRAECSRISKFIDTIMKPDAYSANRQMGATMSIQNLIKEIQPILLPLSLADPSVTTANLES